MKYTRNKIVRMLRGAECKVTFTKVSDGSTRVMRCTLQDEVLDEYDVVTSGDKKPNPDVVNCFDLEAEDWRSFRVDSVKSVVVQ